MQDDAEDNQNIYELAEEPVEMSRLDIEKANLEARKRKASEKKEINKPGLMEPKKSLASRSVEEQAV